MRFVFNGAEGETHLSRVRAARALRIRMSTCRLILRLFRPAGETSQFESPLAKKYRIKKYNLIEVVFNGAEGETHLSRVRAARALRIRMSTCRLILRLFRPAGETSQFESPLAKKYRIKKYNLIEVVFNGAEGETRTRTRG